MKNKLLICLVSFFIFISSSKALMCGNEVKVKYQEMAKNISINYEYVETDNDITFNIKFSNIPETFIIVDEKNGVTYNYSSSELIIPNVNKNTSYKFNILKEDDFCSYVIFYTHYINIPAYNYYYKDEICNGIEDYKLCNKWLNVNYNYDEWKEKVINYKNSLNIEDEIIETQEENIFDKIINFYAKYYMYVLPSLIIMCCVSIYLYNRKHDLF